MRRHTISFKHAFEGLFYAFRTQPNLKIHLFFALAALIGGLLLSINYLEWLIILFTITLVFTSEMINTAIESMTDLITTQHHQSAKIAKDVSASMVLVSAICALIVGLIIFLPRLLSFLIIEK